MNPGPLILAAALLQTALPQNPTPTPQHKHWADVTHKFETDPLDEDAAHDAALVVSDIAVSSDFHVVMCEAFYNEFNDSQYHYHAPIRLLYMLGAATYQVESGKTDQQDTNLYALHSVLKGYAAILRAKPTAHDKELDELAKLDAKNKLDDYVAKKNCK
jgi:hypothetical protein